MCREIAVGSTGAGANVEARLLAQAEELATLHRRRGEHTQQIVDLNNKLQILQKELQTKEIRYNFKVFQYVKNLLHILLKVVYEPVNFEIIIL